MCSGRVEVHHGQAAWARVGAVGWDLQDGSVVCRELGCGQAVVVSRADWSQGSGQLALTGVQCDGTEASLSWCLTDPWRSQSCAQSQDASVTCSGPVPLRLVGGNNACSGRVEVHHQGVWGTVCSGNWSESAADVVCRVLNCGTPRLAAGPAYNSNRSSGFGLQEVTCRGEEAALGLCSTQRWGQLHCNSNQDVGVTCSALLPVRLVDGNDVCSGRVEVHRNRSWGTVCDQDWEQNDAEVVCRMLNCGTAIAAEQGAYYGQGSGGIKLDKVRCDGSELTLDACIAKCPACENCTHGMDAGATCTGPIPVRLVDGSTMCSGRVEVYRNGVWRSICSDGWDDKGAGVVCRMLNCGEVLSPPRILHHGYGVSLDNVSCDGSEPFLDQCSAKPWSLRNCSRAGVTCTGSIRTWKQRGCLSSA
ncbi:scavenger receptor cysteine-rich domain-containing protein DMBT1-like, partial [Mustelus asterias]